MKKLILSAAIVLGSFSTYAATVTGSSTEVCSVSIQEEYKEVKMEEIPDAVKKSLESAYPGATLEKGYVSEKMEYKLEIAVGDQKATVYADANGNWIKK
jgi:20S proteasome alpha/beta subunit